MGITLRMNSLNSKANRGEWPPTAEGQSFICTAFQIIGTALFGMWPHERHLVMEDFCWMLEVL